MGPKLSLALDQIKEGDNKVYYEDLEFVADKKCYEALKQYGTANIDFKRSKFYGAGFSIKYDYDC